MPVSIFTPMNKLFRILIATGVSVVVLVGSIALILLIFDVQSPKIAAVFSISSWLLTYKLIKPSKKELERKETKHVETYHPNGVVMEKGEIVFGKRQGKWDKFNEEGEYIETSYYENGEWRYSKKEDQ